MNAREIYDKLVGAHRPFDFFGEVSWTELKALYRQCAKIVHPDTTKSGDQYLAQEAMKMLGDFYQQAEVEFQNGTYGITIKTSTEYLSNPLFEFTLGKNDFRFYKYFFEGEVADLYWGTCDGESVLIKIATDPNDNCLLEQEYRVLCGLKHKSLPVVKGRVVINDRAAFVMHEIEGTSLTDLMNEYPSGIPAEHVMWMLERLFSAIGYLHFNNLVHGNLKPEHIIVNRDTHNVSIVGFSFSIVSANLDIAHYRIINDVYTPPEVNKTARVMPNADIYAIGKLAVLMLGGDVTNNAMPMRIDERVRAFVRKLVGRNSRLRPNDAWQLWDEVIELRNEVYGKARFQILD